MVLLFLKNIFAPFVLIVLFFCQSGYGEEGVVYQLTIKNHRFIPQELKVPSGKKIEIEVTNQDETAEEFESGDLKREKVIQGGGKAKVFLLPLAPGVYSFYGEFHPETAQGRLLVE